MEKVAQVGWFERRGIKPWQVVFIVAIALAITICEYVFAYQNVAYGIIIALALTIAIYAVISVRRFDPLIMHSAESLAIIPLYILFTSSLPWFFVDQQYLLPAVYSCILGLCFWHIYRQNLDLAGLFGFSKRRLPKDFLIGLAVGVVLGPLEYFILRPAPAFPSFQIIYLFRDIIYMFVFVGLAEELLFRGLIQRNLMVAFGWKWALFAASALFAVMHLTWRSVPELGFVFIAGVALGVLYWKTKSLVAPIVAHGANNVMLVSVLPYLFMS